MRHSRRRVMKEHYKLYMRKHILNGRYFQRNLQVVMCMVLVVALTVGCITVGKTIGSSDGSNHEVSVKEALFGNNESNTKSVAKDTEEVTETTVVSEDTEATTATEAAITEAVAVLADTTEAATEEPSLFDDRCIANVEDTLNIRQEPNTDSEFVGSMESGAIAIVEGTEGEWTKIKSGDVEGYVLTQYILTGAVAEAFAKDYVILHGTVLEDGVNVRTEKSTDADIVTVLDKDAVVTVLDDPNAEENTDSSVVASTEQTEATTESTSTESASTEAAVQTEEATPAVETATEESTDDITWMQVRLEDGQEGYVSADFISVDELYQVAVSKEELERKAAEEEAARKAAEEEAARQAAAEEAARKAANTKKTTGSVSSGNGGSYKGASIAPITAAQAGESLGTFTITGYCGCAKCSGGRDIGSVPDGL